MRIHHLNCGTFAPRGKLFIEGYGKPWQRARMVCHCLLIETNNALILIDTGLGLSDIAHPYKRLGFFFTKTLSPILGPEETAAHQVQALGYNVNDVSDIMFTHLDLDHIGGADDFPHARLHVASTEADAVRSPINFKERYRFRNALGLMQRHKNSHIEHNLHGDSWFGFDAAQQISNLPEEIALIPLRGHTRGHAGIVIDTGRTDQPRWVVHAGDTFIHHNQMNPVDLPYPRLLHFLQFAYSDDRPAQHNNIQRLRELSATGDIEIINSHDATLFDCCAGRSAT